MTEELERLSVSEEAKLARRKYIRSWIVGALAFIVTTIVAHYVTVLLAIFDKATGLVK